MNNVCKFMPSKYNNEGNYDNENHIQDRKQQVKNNCHKS